MSAGARPRRQEAPTLHITNGDAAIARLRAAGIAGDIVSWDDVLHEGPVPGGLGFAQLREARARFIAERGWCTVGEARKRFMDRDAALDGAAGGELVLWFEHDLYDQLQLLQILHRLGTQGPDPAGLTLVCEAEYLGMMPAERVRQLHERRRSVTREQVALALQAWTAFTAPEAARLSDLITGDTSALPFLAPALERHLEEFPSTRTGLSRSEQQALEALDGGALTPAEAFPRSHHEREDPVFLGDTVFAWYLERLSRVTVPLVTLEGGATVLAPATDADARTFWNARLALTDAGRAVLAGRENHVALNGIDRWLGGVHLEVAPGRPWLPPL